MRVVAISGSLQAASSNTALVRLAAGLSDSRVSVAVFDGLADLPYFNPDLDGEEPPRAVTELRTSVGLADGVLIASPEYAHEMPGVLKNALDWLVRSGELYGKPVALLCAAPSAERGGYAREALRQTLTAQGATVVASITIAVVPPTPRAGRAWPAEARATLADALEALISASPKP
jgi:chromate reductase, NAD(P)H dehydrogenase (quinone)